MDVNCSDPFSTTLNDNPEQVRIKSVKLSQLLYADAANDVFTRESLVGKFFSVLIFLVLMKIISSHQMLLALKCFEKRTCNHTTS